MEITVTTMENSGRGASQKLKIELPNDPAIPLQGQHQNKCKSGCSKDTCAAMFIVMLFTKAKLYSQDVPLLINVLRKCGII
jgi:hypothetical protein